MLIKVTGLSYFERVCDRGFRNIPALASSKKQQHVCDRGKGAPTPMSYGSEYHVCYNTKFSKVAASVLNPLLWEWH